MAARDSIMIVCAVAVIYGGALLFFSHAAERSGQTLEGWIVGPSDSLEYYQLAVGLIERGEFALPYSGAEFFRTPGYPIFVAGTLSFFGTVAAIPLIQMVLTALCALLIYGIGSALFARWAAIAAALLYAADPTVIFHTLTLYTEALFCTLFLGAVYVAVCLRPTRRAALALGFTLGASVLVRSVGLYLAPIVIAWFVYRQWDRRRDALIAAIVSVSAAAMVCLPWGMRNFMHSGHATLSSIGAYNAVLYNVVEFDSFRTGVSKQEIRRRILERIGVSDTSALRGFAHAEEQSAIIRDSIVSHAFSYSVFHLYKTLPFFLGSSFEAAIRSAYSHDIFEGAVPEDLNLSNLVASRDAARVFAAMRAHPLYAAEYAFWIMVCGFAALEVCAAFKRSRRALVRALFAATIVAMFAVLAGPVSMPRYRMPAEAFLFLLAASGALYAGRVFGRVRQWTAS